MSNTPIKAIKSVYLAGKMPGEGGRHADWRDEFFDVNRLEHSKYSPLFTFNEEWEWEVLGNAIHGLSYTGPYFVDNLGGHGYSQTMEEEEFSPGDCAHGGYVEREHGAYRSDQMEQVQMMCFQAIQRSDLIFAWIDSLDCFGTFAELGYAKAFGKLIWIGSPANFWRSETLWFIYEMADKVAFADAAYDAFKRLYTPYMPKKSKRVFTSPIEQAFWDAWHDLPEEAVQAFPLVPQYPIGKYRVDFAHVATRTAIELDGFATHSSTDDIAYDRKRQRWIEAQGWHVIRFGGKEIMSKAYVCVEEVYSALLRKSGRASMPTKELSQRRVTPQSSQFVAGNLVSHDKFGAGTILKSEMVNGTEYVDIQFTGKIGKKRLSMDFAKLERRVATCEKCKEVICPKCGKCHSCSRT